jgi:hypothetical protein
VLAEIKRITVFFDELDFAHDPSLGAPRLDLPTSQLSDFLLELIDTTIGVTDADARLDERPTRSPVFFEPAASSGSSR